MASKLNGFVTRNTAGLIKDIVKSNMISPGSFMILINTIYFQAKWLIPFSAKQTSQPAPFYNALTNNNINNNSDRNNNSQAKQILKVRYMTKTHKFAYFEEKNICNCWKWTMSNPRLVLACCCPSSPPLALVLVAFLPSTVTK